MAGKLKTNEVILQSPNGLQEATLSVSDSGVVSSNKTVTLASPTITNNHIFKGENVSGQLFESNLTVRLTLQEVYDTNNNFDNSRFTPTKSGYYLINGKIRVDTGATRVIGYFFKNSTQFGAFADLWNVPSAFTGSGSTIVYMNGTTDYIELWAYEFGGNYTLFGELSGIYIGS